jgi:MoaA/NifB/PqqE/SkfB family radical SAM enzyme
MSKKMNLTDKLYQEFVLERIDKTDWKKGNSAPLVIELDPTAACDLACPGCISEDIIAVGNRFSNDRLMSLGKEFIESGVKAVILIGGGEPLAHRKIGDFMDLLGQNDIHIGITTNGTFINKYIDQISKYSSWTRISMDAATDKLFNILRPTKAKGAGSKFDHIIENMRMLAKSKKGKLGYSYLITTEMDGPGIISNVHEIYDAALLARDIGCDYFEVKPSYQFRDDVEHSLMKHDKKLMDEAKAQIDSLDELENENFKILKAINLEYSLNLVETDQPKDYKTCPSTHLRTTVTPSGVFVCPYWRGKKKMHLGDLNTTTFTEMWNGDLRNKVMDRLDVSKDCNFHCLRNETNKTCLDIKDKQQKGREITAVEEFDRFI